MRDLLRRQRLRLVTQPIEQIICGNHNDVIQRQSRVEPSADYGDDRAYLTRESARRRKQRRCASRLADTLPCVWHPRLAQEDCVAAFRLKAATGVMFGVDCVDATRPDDYMVDVRTTGTYRNRMQDMPTGPQPRQLNADDLLANEPNSEADEVVGERPEPSGGGCGMQVREMGQYGVPRTMCCEIGTSNIGFV